MTQAFNLSQFANNLNSQGQVDAADGLVNAVPITNGGTGATTIAAAQTNLNVPSRDGANSSGTWPINISGHSASYQGVNFSIFEAGNQLLFQYQGTTIAIIDSAGNFSTVQNVTAYGTL